MTPAQERGLHEGQWVYRKNRPDGSGNFNTGWVKLILDDGTHTPMFRDCDHSAYGDFRLIDWTQGIHNEKPDWTPGEQQFYPGDVVRVKCAHLSEHVEYPSALEPDLFWNTVVPEMRWCEGQIDVIEQRGVSGYHLENIAYVWLPEWLELVERADDWKIGSEPNHHAIDWSEVEEQSALSTQEGGDHYRRYAIQPAEFIQRNGLGWCQGNVVKYVTRHATKGGMEDLRKAKHYIDMLAEFVYGEEL